MTGIFTELFPKDPTFNRASRIKKAQKIVAVLKDMEKGLSEKNCLDLGSSMGYISQYLGKHFKKVVGIDVDFLAINKAKKINSLKNVSFFLSQKNKIPFPSNYFDVVVFNQIYEHVQNPNQLISEIQRVLKPGGFCYFGARNKYFVFDGHYPFPFLAFIPKILANFVVRIFWHKKEYDINLCSLKELKRLVKNFIVHDYTLEVIRYPKKYLIDYRLLKDFSFSRQIYLLGKIFYFFIPNYIWILEKSK